MDASGQPPKHGPRVSGHHSRKTKTRWLLLLAGCAVLSLALIFQIGGFSPGGVAYGAPLNHSGSNVANALDATPTITVPAANPPTLSLAVPSSGAGPVGAHLTVTGSNWGAADVAIGAAAPGASCADPNSWIQTLLHVRPQADQTIVFTFTWPSGLTGAGTPYLICASNSAGMANVSYRVLSTAPASLALSPTTTNAGSLVTITGANFLGSGTITLSVTDGQGNSRDLTTVSPDAGGAFSLQYQPRPTDVGDETIYAIAKANVPQNMEPAIVVSAKLHVDPALTPTPGATPTSSVVASPGTRDTSNNSSPLLLIVLGILGLLLAIGAAVAVFFVVVRNRNKPDDGGQFGAARYGGSNPGFGRPGNIYNDMYQDPGPGTGGVANMGNPEWDAPTQAGYPTYDPYDRGGYAGDDPYGQSGYPPQPGYGAGGWPEPEEPDPNWRPRPMTGQGHVQDDYGQNPPPDPWANPENSYGQQGQPYGGGQSFGGSSRGGTGGGYPPQQRRGPDDSRRPNSGGAGRGNPGDSPNDPLGQYPEQPRGQDW